MAVMGGRGDGSDVGRCDGSDGGRGDRREVMGEVEIKVWDGTCSTMNCACRSSRSSVKLVQPIDWGGTVV